MNSESTANNKDSSHPFDLLLEIDRRNAQRSHYETSATIESSAIKGQLAFRLGPWSLMFPMDDVAEIIPIPRVTRVPGVRSWLMGIANLRGTVVSVIDLREFLGGKPTTITSISRLIIVRSGEWTYGFLVDEIIGMRNFSLQRKLPTLDGIDPHLLPYITDGFESDGKKWLAFGIGELLTNSKFLNATH
jgi:twitching motility protein PilI